MCKHTFTHVHLYVYQYIYMYIYMHVCTYIHLYIHIYIIPSMWTSQTSTRYVLEAEPGRPKGRLAVT